MHMKVTIDMLDDKSKDLLYLTFMNGAGVTIENTQQPDELLVRACNHKENTVIAKAKDVKLLFENGYMHVLNGTITASNKLVLIAEQPLNSPYQFNSDLYELQKQHPEVRAYEEEREREWQARLEANRIEKEKQRKIEEQKKAEEEAFLKTPKGKLVNAARKTRDALGNGMNSFMIMMDSFSRDVEDAQYDAAKRRQQTGMYFGDLGFRNIQKANDKFILEHHQHHH